MLLPPALYLVAREQKNLRKILTGTLVFGIIFAFVFDFIESFNQAWVVTRLVFPSGIFSFYPYLIDNIIGYALMTFLILVFYEHFLDDEKNRRISKNLLYALIPSLAAAATILAIYFLNPDFLRIPYAYFLGGLAAVTMPLILTISKPNFIGKFLKILVFFSWVWFISELVALKVSGWIFPGQYLGMVKIIGMVFPLEELFFWMFCYAASTVAYYEIFVDDLK